MRRPGPPTLASLALISVLGAPAVRGADAPLAAAAVALETKLVARHGEAERTRISKGLKQVASLWRAADGDAAAYSAFAEAHFAPAGPALDALFLRLEFALESLDGHFNEIGRDLKRQSELDLGPIEPVDEILAAWEPGAHVADDLFENKLAFAVLLNFPMTTLAERLASGEGWTRRQWAEARLVDRFKRRIPAEVSQEIARAAAEARQYVASYNVWMHHVVDAKGRRLFPPKLKLLSHWNLRDEIKSAYADKANGLAKQRTIQRVMERIVTQTIPERAVDNPQVDWDPETLRVVPTTSPDSAYAPAARGAAAPLDAREGDTRYARLLATFRAARLADPYSPSAPTHLARSFEEGRQIPEARVVKMLEDVLSSPLVPEVAALIRKRLARPLEPFDVWYAGFRPTAAYDEKALDAITKKRYPTPKAFQDDIPRILTALGFAEVTAERVAANIVVDPARGSGHALGAARREDKAHLRTRVGPDGMDYKGYNIAVHELGHNVEQTFSLNDVDHTLLAGVPNTAFTEALAFVFQARDLELLGLSKPDARSKAEKTLDSFWGTYEIAGVALVDIGVWRYLYEHPDATPETLREATLAIAKKVWNRWYAPVFGVKDVVLLGVYSHMIEAFLYLPDYPVGHLIAHQIEGQIEKAGSVGGEFERMAKVGNVTPDLWMKKATGAPVGAEALLSATKKALADLGSSGAR